MTHLHHSHCDGRNVGDPQQTRYLVGEGNKRATTSGADWGGDPSVDPHAGR